MKLLNKYCTYNRENEISATALNRSSTVCTQECMVFIQKARGKEFCLDILNMIQFPVLHKNMSDTQLLVHLLFPFSVGSSWNDNKTKSQGIGKNLSDIMGFHIQVIFHIFYRYMGKEYHYFDIILKYRVNSVSFTMQYFKN